MPVHGNLTNSPGTTLAFRLPPGISPAWSLSMWLGAAMIWNGILAPFAIIAIHGVFEREPDWVLIGFVLPFLAIGMGLIAYFLRQVVVITRIGPTLVEVSDQPMHVGGRYELFLSQTGRLRMKALDVLLVCEEEATFRHGTNTRKEIRRVFQQPVFRREGFDIRFGEPFYTRCGVEVPRGAMHSFHSAHNQVNWKIVVRGEVNGWPCYERSYPLIVCPNPHGNGAQ